MATVTITNLTTSPLTIQDLYVTIAASASITVTRATSDIARMPTLQAAVATGSAAVGVVLTSDEATSGLTTTDSSVTASDLMPVAAATSISPEVVIRVPMVTGGAAGTADDVTVFANNAVPYKMRIMDAYALISTASTGSAKTLSLYTQAAAAGTLLAVVSSASTGRAGVTSAFTSTPVLTPGATTGLFIRRADRDAVGELVIIARRES